jgi:hypothetical protein
MTHAELLSWISVGWITFGWTSLDWISFGWISFGNEGCALSRYRLRCAI